MARLVDVIFNSDDTPNKFWMSFSKRTFMGREA